MLGVSIRADRVGGDLGTLVQDLHLALKAGFRAVELPAHGLGVIAGGRQSGWRIPAFPVERELLPLLHGWERGIHVIELHRLHFDLPTLTVARREAEELLAVREAGVPT